MYKYAKLFYYALFYSIINPIKFNIRSTNFFLGDVLKSPEMPDYYPFKANDYGPFLKNTEEKNHIFKKI